MYCRHCGMDSRNPSVCEWCKKPLAGGQAPAQPAPLNLTQPIPPPLDLTQPVPPPVPGAGGGQVRVALTGEVVEVPPAAPPAGSYSPPPTGHYAAPGPPTSAAGVRPPSVMPAHGIPRDLPVSAVGPHLMQAQVRWDQPTTGEKWEKCLAIVMPLLLASVVLIHFVHNAFLWVALADVFLVGLVMGATGAIGAYEEAYLDVGVVLLVCFLLGPTIALMVYGIVGLIKQEWNTAILLLLFGHMFVRLILIISFSVEAEALTVLPQMMVLNIAGFLSVCASFAGWILSSFFRPLNE